MIAYRTIHDQRWVTAYAVGLCIIPVESGCGVRVGGSGCIFWLVLGLSL